MVRTALLGTEGFQLPGNRLTKRTWAAFGEGPASECQFLPHHAITERPPAGKRRLWERARLFSQRTKRRQLLLQHRKSGAPRRLRVFVLHYWNVYSLSERPLELAAQSSLLATVRSKTLLTERSLGKYSDTRRFCISETARAFFFPSRPNSHKSRFALAKKKRQSNNGCLNWPPEASQSRSFPRPTGIQHGRAFISMQLLTRQHTLKKFFFFGVYWWLSHYAAPIEHVALHTRLL